MLQLTIDPAGVVRFVYDDALRFLLDEGVGSIARASHVEPTPDGRWTADLSPVGGPVLGPYPTRQDARAQEVAWLHVHVA